MISSKQKKIRLKNIPISFIADQKFFFILTTLFVLLLALMLVSLGSGTISISIPRVILTLLGEGSAVENFAILKHRLPRILLGVLVGSGLALSGAILQGLIKNPLASPDIIGINSGASLMAVIFIILLGDQFSIRLLPLFSFLGSLFTVFILYILSWKNGINPFRMVLIGFGVTALLGSAQTIIMLNGNITAVGSAYTWLTGSLHATQWHEVRIVAFWMLILIPTTLLMAMSLNLQQVSDDITVSLGGNLQRIRVILIILAACLAGISVAFAGGIGFVGLMAPHIARKLVGTSYGQLLPCSALVGSIIVVFADWIGRTWFAPLDIAVGVFTALIGAPFFLYLFISMGKK